MWTLDHIPRFTRTTMPPADLPLEGSMIGIYDSGEGEERIVVTLAGIHARIDHQWREVRFADFARVRSDADKVEGKMIELTLTNGEVLNIHVSGHTGRFRDLYEISRFLARAATAASLPAAD